MELALIVRPLIRQLMETFPDESACREFLFNRRWLTAKSLARAAAKSGFVYKIAMPWKWECSNKGCRRGNVYRFSLTAGTIFENTKYPLTTWFKALWAILRSKEGISSLQLRRMYFEETTSLRTAGYRSHRLRAARYEEDFRQHMGIVEIDETYAGEKKANRQCGGSRQIYQTRRAWNWQDDRHRSHRA